MKDDYLWDQSGDADPEVQQLEEILGTLKYQPRDLEIPSQQQMRRTGSVLSPRRIAAAVALIMLGAGVWFAVSRRAGSEIVRTPQQVTNSELAAQGNVDEKKLNGLQASAITPRAGTESVTASPHHYRRAGKHMNQTQYSNARRQSAEIARAKVAKEQLMLALHLASAKLNYAQKRITGSG
jgi:hypothetical protein